MSEVKILSSEYISEHQYFTARKDKYEMPSGKVVDTYYVVELPVSVCALAITKNNEVILVEQYRHPVGEKMLEIPGGFIDKGEDPQQAIARELLEETGYTFENYIHLAKTAANPGVLNNYTHLFLATGGTKTGEQELDANEEISLILQPVEAVKRLLEENKIPQAMHALCMFYAFQQLDSQES